MRAEGTDLFEHRHIGPRAADCDDMLRQIGAPSMDALIDEALPASIRLRDPLPLPDAETEFEYLSRLRTLVARNRLCRSFIGMGYHDTITPSVIVRNILENPGWYTPYTPYQAEIAQGRLEALLNFQTLVSDLTGMEIANASLLDEATAAAEAMAMLHRVQSGGGTVRRHVFLVSPTCFPQTLDVLRLRAAPLGIELRLEDIGRAALDERIFGALIQTPDDDGALVDARDFIARAHEAGIRVAVAADLLSLAIVTPPGEMGADVVVGSAQRFGVPMGYGGPHAAFFATREEFVRQMPGRLIGVSRDARGNPALRMALQTREQHIRRERATSNICTAQALLATMAGMYGVYHGPDGLKAIARRILTHATVLERTLTAHGFTQHNAAYFDTLKVRFERSPDEAARQVRSAAVRAGVNLRYFADGHIGIALNETTNRTDVAELVEVFAGSVEGIRRLDIIWPGAGAHLEEELPGPLRRSTPFMTHPVFNAHRSETAMMRYIRSLERKDIGLQTSMVPLGSCTMKLNAASEMMPVTWPEISRLHPFVPLDQAEGYQQMFRELESALSAITGLPAVSLQPNSGAQGELAGLLVIRAYHRARGEERRDVVLIPSSAHGTNPASASMAGLRVVVVACDAHGNVDVADLRAKAAAHADDLAALMVTYPSTHGVFEDAIQEICALVHERGGQVYMDGANLNAQVGLTSPARIGADVCHINLHKTFSIPHGGGGPGMGPIAVASHLAPYLPGHPVVQVGGDRAIGAVAAAPWGSASILVISYGYLRMLGAQGATAATQFAILNANYLKSRLERHYPVLFTRQNGRVAHELIFDLRAFKASGIDEQDVAKRLMDYGFHAPTVSFPVPGTLMVEPTESEPKEELDRFCDAMIAIRGEIQEVIDGVADPRDNVLKNAPHTALEAAGDSWQHGYSREKAVYPLPYVRERKVWPPVGRIDSPYGDRNLMCACPPVVDYVK
jgi:glycine dehydrogenase